MHESNELHPLGIRIRTPEERVRLEAVDPRFIHDGLLRAREKTIDALGELRSRLRVGMNEDDARRLALEVFRERGVTKHWHRPYIRIGAGTRFTFNDPLQLTETLQPGAPYYIDLGPVWPADPAATEADLEYEGDYGDTFIFEDATAAEPRFDAAISRAATQCASDARTLFHEAQTFWRQSLTDPNHPDLADPATGHEIYRRLQMRAEELGYRLLIDAGGHRVSEFPHHRHGKDNLATLDFVPSESLWVLEVMITDPAGRFGAFFEDLL